MSDSGADAYLVSGFRERSEGSWRWAHEHPVLRFQLPPLGGARFAMDFALPDLTFRATGPVTLAVSIDGHRLPPARYEQAGEHQFAAQVPAEFLPPAGGVVRVEIEPDKVAEPNPGEKLSFVLIRAGFAE